MPIDKDKIKSIKCENIWIDGATSTQIGGRSENQDAVLIQNTPFGVAVIVCDGMGGGPGGATASAIASEEIAKGIKEGLPEEARINIVRKAIRRANDAILDRAAREVELQGMGSTCTVALFNEDSVIVAHVGDSRIYQLRGKRKRWRTFDHSLVFGLVRQGIITEEQARLSAESNVITRALGIKLDPEIDAEERAFERGDRFVLTTDGIHGSMPEKQLLKLFTDRSVTPKKLVKRIAKKVEEIGVMNGNHHDNHTIALVDIKKNSKLKEKMSRTTKQIISILAILLITSLLLNMFLWGRLNKLQATESNAENSQEIEIVNVPLEDKSKASTINASSNADETELKEEPASKEVKRGQALPKGKASNNKK